MTSMPWRNVQCTRTLPNGRRCWKGSRYPNTGQYPWNLWFTPEIQQRYYAEQTQRITANPCPRCGSPVELRQIEEQEN